ncbi:MAG: DUF975 family protein, partial [Coriobacteriales bacterium]|nr:DUF975 family protein [Coriobacteriales bacterium]
MTDSTHTKDGTPADAPTPTPGDAPTPTPGDADVPTPGDADAPTPPSTSSPKLRTIATKRAARRSLLRNFGVCFSTCVILAFIMYNPSTFSDDVNAVSNGLRSAAAQAPDTPLAEGINDLLSTVDAVKGATSLGTDSSAGVISSVYTKVRSAGSVHGAVLDLINSSLFSNRLSQTLLAGVGLLVSLLAFLFLREMLSIGACRLFLENRIYPKTPLARLFFVYQMRRTLACALIVFLKYLYLLLWSLTIVGLPIKYYSYYLVPFIQAENPSVSARTVFKLSENMMRGQRFRVFLFDLSFIGWVLLSTLTLGLVGYLWLNPYRMAAQAELYATLRASAQARGLAGTEALRDGALFTPYDGPVPDVLEGEKGLALTDGVYPFAMYRTLAQRMLLRMSVGARDRYTVVNLALMFFLFSFVGWLWECGIAFVESGTFINRGMLYGPWVPIYGFGGLAVVVVLGRLSTRPMLCFITAVVMCGIIEYVGATLIWDWYHVKYWDYSGFFFNIQGRVCLEGLLAFGVLGMVALYVVAPMTDELFLKIPLKVRHAL